MRAGRGPKHRGEQIGNATLCAQFGHRGRGDNWRKDFDRSGCHPRNQTLLNRLARDSLLGYEWRESGQGPPRKYYWLTDEGKTVLANLQDTYARLDKSIKQLEKGAS